MTNDETPLDTGEIEDRIDQLGRYSRFVRAGFGVILVAFLLALVGRLPYNLDSVPGAVDAILMPLIFVGMGLLLFGIGMHLHVMHLNVVAQLRRRRSDDETGTDS
ncbi:hypothetical protein SAMN04488063_0339 [Halopelagius inordinatus]|uniref:Uncharacterized protein n=1 Tax=Halopelagius inordinatus TaxID=553467 RepID=A0A1I2LM17_9EURY|nr:hypothetical protein [Halopelagius inordinatus]SFF80153.1 hypothetical protein SAMN04488063_0339 [Halopelagius inordinatus]